MIISYQRDDEVPVWKEEKVINGKLVWTRWKVILWTREVLTFPSRQQAVAAYWR